MSEVSEYYKRPTIAQQREDITNLEAEIERLEKELYSLRATLKITKNFVKQLEKIELEKK